MTLSIRDPDANKMAREAAQRTGKTITLVVKEALADYLAKAPPHSREEKLRAMDRYLAELDALPILDPRSSRELLDDLYDEHGLPK